MTIKAETAAWSNSSGEQKCRSQEKREDALTSGLQGDSVRRVRAGGGIQQVLAVPMVTARRRC
jgi:hypothetical protein